MYDPHPQGPVLRLVQQEPKPPHTITRAMVEAGIAACRSASPQVGSFTPDDLVRRIWIAMKAAQVSDADAPGGSAGDGA
ncbi:hypothetical protein U8607_22940 [Methylobacterium durans]|uniref:hypothetical protein n=1 Tax=Methylobacterium durans TaxID=2202825 RepID=UPI002B002878|nr:hypothetical protein [Methylobacterium durans]MEA1834955.1 hypothetical protein [Methylobacterium durans]